MIYIGDTYSALVIWVTENLNSIFVFDKRLMTVCKL